MDSKTGDNSTDAYESGFCKYILDKKHRVKLMQTRVAVMEIELPNARKIWDTNMRSLCD